MRSAHREMTDTHAHKVRTHPIRLVCMCRIHGGGGSDGWLLYCRFFDDVRGLAGMKMFVLQCATRNAKSLENWNM